jgi:hypothetical protein
MPSLAQVQAAADTVIAGIETTLGTLQVTYSGQHSSRYFQGIITTPLASIPNNLNDANPVVATMTPNLLVKPTDQSETWVDFDISIPAIPFAIQIDVYDSRGGWGFVVHLIVKWANQLYARSINIGPEGYRTSVWALMP